MSFMSDRPSDNLIFSLSAFHRSQMLARNLEICLDSTLALDAQKIK
jgi:hypothetical protein